MRHVAFVLALSCARPPPAPVAQLADLTTCTIAPSADELPLVRAAVARCPRVTLSPGRHLWSVSSPRATALVVVPAGVSLAGAGRDLTSVVLSGDAAGQDLIGVSLAGSLADLAVSTDLAGTTEHVVPVRLDGPSRGARLTRVRVTNLPRPTLKTGDCVQVVGYPDREVWAFVAEDLDLDGCGRAGIAVHSGLRGDLQPDGRWSTRISRVHARRVRGQVFDGEGTGDVDGVEIDHLVHDASPDPHSPVAVQIQLAGRVYLHDSRLSGALDVQCDGCILADLDVVVADPSGAPVVRLRGATHVALARSRLTRLASAGPGQVVSAEGGGAVSLESLVVTQLAAGEALLDLGASSLGLTDVDVDMSGPPHLYDALEIVASTTSAAGPVRVDRLTVSGAPRAAALTSGAHLGAAGLDATSVSATTALEGLRCETPASVGPVTCALCLAPPSSCAGVLTSVTPP